MFPSDVHLNTYPNTQPARCVPLRLSAARAVSMGAGAAPRGSAVADFDNDGKPDLVVTNSGKGTVTLLRGDGGGNLRAPTSIPVGASPALLDAGDFNRDGNMDVAVPNTGSDSVTILLGDGTGAFPGSRLVRTPSPRHVVAADMNLDGELDLVIANGDALGGISVALGDGAGGFALPLTYAASAGTAQLAVRDLNADGLLDVAACTSDALIVRLGDGLGGLPVQSASRNAHPNDVTAADLDCDGKLDLVYTDDGTGELLALRGHGDGTFEAPGLGTPLPVGTQPHGVVASDVNHDGYVDVLTANGTRNKIGVSFNRRGVLTAEVPYAGDLNPVHLAQGDLNGDHFTDFVATNLGSDDVTVLLNDGTGTGKLLAASLSVTAPEALGALSLADLNHDARLDVVVTRPGSSRVATYLGDGAGNFLAGNTVATPVAPTLLSVADLNGDNFLDLTVAGSSGAAVAPSSAGAFATFTSLPGLAGSARALASADLDRDGKPDLLTASGTTLSVAPGTGGGAFGAPVPHVVGSDLTAVAVADCDGNGSQDVWVADATQNRHPPEEQRRRRPRPPAAPERPRRPRGPRRRRHRPRRRLDLIAANSATSDLTLWRGDGAPAA